MCVCVSTHQAITYYSRKMKPEYLCKQVILFIYTAPAVDIANGRGHSKEAHCALLLKMTKKSISAVQLAIHAVLPALHY